MPGGVCPGSEGLGQPLQCLLVSILSPGFPLNILHSVPPDVCPPSVRPAAHALQLPDISAQVARAQRVSHNSSGEGLGQTSQWAGQAGLRGLIQT